MLELLKPWRDSNLNWAQVGKPNPSLIQVLKMIIQTRPNVELALFMSHVWPTVYFCVLIYFVCLFGSFIYAVYAFVRHVDQNKMTYWLTICMIVCSLIVRAYIFVFHMKSHALGKKY